MLPFRDYGNTLDVKLAVRWLCGGTLCSQRRWAEPVPQRLHTCGAANVVRTGMFGFVADSVNEVTVRHDGVGLIAEPRVVEAAPDSVNATVNE